MPSLSYMLQKLIALPFSELTYQNWKIAIIVDIVQEAQEDGAVTILKIHTGKRTCITSLQAIALAEVLCRRQVRTAP